MTEGRCYETYCGLQGQVRVGLVDQVGRVSHHDLDDTDLRLGAGGGVYRGHECIGPPLEARRAHWPPRLRPMFPSEPADARAWREGTAELDRPSAFESQLGGAR